MGLSGSEGGRFGVFDGVNQTGSHTVYWEGTVCIEKEGEMDGGCGPDKCGGIRITHDVTGGGAIRMNETFVSSAGMDVYEAPATMDGHAGNEGAGEQPPTTNELLGEGVKGGA